MSSWLIELPGLPRLQGKVHWRTVTTERATWKRAVWAHIMAMDDLPVAPLARARLTFTRFSSKEPDQGDNIGASFKSCRDGLIGFLIEDDTPEVVGTPLYLWEPAPPKKGRVSILVEDANLVQTVCLSCGRPL